MRLCRWSCSCGKSWKHWIPLEHIISIDKNTKTAVVKWEETRKKDTVHLGDCKKFNKLDVIPRNVNQQISFVRYHRQRGESHLLAKWKTYFFYENSSKLCAEFAIQNLLNKLHFLPEDMNIFGELATSDLVTLMKSLNESYVPKAVLKPSLGIDLIQKCLWILCKKFKFQTTKKLNYKHFQCLKCLLKVILEIKFPVLISVKSKLLLTTMWLLSRERW